MQSLALSGIDALPVEVEVDVGAGLPGFSIVGLPDAAVQEARKGASSDLQQRLQVPDQEGHRKPRSGQLAQRGTVGKPDSPRRLSFFLSRLWS